MPDKCRWTKINCKMWKILIFLILQINGVFRTIFFTKMCFLHKQKNIVKNVLKTSFLFLRSKKHENTVFHVSYHFSKSGLNTPSFWNKQICVEHTHLLVLNEGVWPTNFFLKNWKLFYEMWARIKTSSCCALTSLSLAQKGETFFTSVPHIGVGLKTFIVVIQNKVL